MPRTSASRTILLALLAAALLASCAPARPPATGAPGEAAVRELVRAYNLKLAQGFREQDMNALNTVATKDQATTEYYQMAALGEGKVKLLSTPRSVTFLRTEFASADTATVETEEVWDYVQVSTETSAVVRTESGVVYRLRYGIVRMDGRWLVDSVEQLRPGAGEDPGR